jgi:hypothetical protein
MAFGDGIETDHLDLSWGQEDRIRIAAQSLALM